MLFHIENITRIITTFAAHSYCAIEDDDALAYLLSCMSYYLAFWAILQFYLQIEVGGQYFIISSIYLLIYFLKQTFPTEKPKRRPQFPRQGSIKLKIHERNGHCNKIESTYASRNAPF